MIRTAWLYAGHHKKVMAVVDLMNLEDQVDLDFTVARRRARLGRLKTLLRGTKSTLLSPRRDPADRSGQRSYVSG